ncbi:uncharacterized protein LOC106648847 isoform X1 [Trichogramma pretiosum]|uniref:uncharacterized protein LOC106648847 isoform X1 n=1 Tax=Trichogramma pretiosum TaxID=7493 RepID=UPI0006C98F81|nr:uncharacterized protein LOC106648847 isoform X1 [Trichogramma pretiosum]
MDEQSNWRGNDSPSNKRHWSPSDIRRRRLLDTVRIKIPKKSMNDKAAVLDDLLLQFAAKRKKNGLADDCQAHIKDRFNFVKKPEMKPQSLSKKNIQNAALRMKDGDDKISDLVTDIKSSKFRISSDPSVDCNITHGVATLSCYSNIPRITAVTEDLSDAPLQDCSRPQITNKLENISIHCDPKTYDNGTTNQQINNEFLDQTSRLSLDKNVSNGSGATAAHQQQQAIVECSTNCSRRFIE